MIMSKIVKGIAQVNLIIYYIIKFKARNNYAYIGESYAT